MISRNTSTLIDASAVILAGGIASRPGGAARTFLDLGGEAILDRQLAVLGPRFPEIMVAVGPPFGDEAPPEAMRPFLARGLRVVADLFPGSGPLAGLHAALEACRTPWLFAVACDVPFLDGDLIDRIAALSAGAGGYDALVPGPEGRPEPLHALYRASIAKYAEACLRSGRRGMTALLGRVRTWILEEKDLPGMSDSYAWLNLSDPEDLAAAAEAIERSMVGSIRGAGRGLAALRDPSSPSRTRRPGR